MSDIFPFLCIKTIRTFFHAFGTWRWRRHVLRRSVRTWIIASPPSSRMSPPTGLLRFNIFIDASTSDGSMDGGSMEEFVVGASCESWSAEAEAPLDLYSSSWNSSHLFTIRFLSWMCVSSSSTIDISWRPFPKRCLGLACFRLLLFSMASMICFSSCLRMSSFVFRRIDIYIYIYIWECVHRIQDAEYNVNDISQILSHLSTH